MKTLQVTYVKTCQLRSTWRWIKIDVGLHHSSHEFQSLNVPKNVQMGDFCDKIVDLEKA